MPSGDTRFGVQSYLLRLDIYYGWFVAVSCFFIAVATFGLLYSFGVFFTHILEEFDQTYGGTSFIFSLQTVVMFFGAAVLGFLIDRYGVRRLLFIGTGLVGVGMFAVTQLVTYLGVMIAYSVVAALGFAITFVVAYATVPRWFGRRRGLATGLATSGTGIGVLLAPPFASALIAQYGWRSAYLVMTALLLSFLLVTLLVITDRPADLGVDASVEFPVSEPPTEDTESLREQLRTISDIATSRTFVLFFLGMAGAYAPFYLLLVYLVEFAGATGIGRGVGVTAVSLVGGMSVVSRLLVGSVSDRWSEKSYFFAGSALCMAVAFGLLALVPTRLNFYVLAALFGLGYGGAGALISPVIAQFFGTLKLNTFFGLASISLAVSGMVAPYLAGRAYDLIGTFVDIFVVASAIGLVGSGLIIAAHFVHLRRANPVGA